MRRIQWGGGGVKGEHSENSKPRICSFVFLMTFLCFLNSNEQMISPGSLCNEEGVFGKVH